MKYIPIKLIYLISPTSDKKGCDRIRNHVIISESIEYIKDVNNELLICDDTQTQLTGTQ